MANHTIRFGETKSNSYQNSPSVSPSSLLGSRRFLVVGVCSIMKLMAFSVARSSFFIIFCNLRNLHTNSHITEYNFSLSKFYLLFLTVIQVIAPSGCISKSIPYYSLLSVFSKRQFLLFCG